MRGASLRRREFLASASLSVLALTACATAAPRTVAELNADEVRVLERTARMIYPHDRLGDEVYTEVVAGIVADASVARRAELAAGVDQIVEGRPLPEWLAVNDRGAHLLWLAFLADQQEPFFVSFRGEIQSRLYEHPAVWAMLGYPGPALPFGGYVDKGFDDIDWLPDSALAEPV